jgi:hypothetical protein
MSSDIDSDEVLDRRLSSRELTIISKHVLVWPDKARLLGLSESEIEDIREDNKNSNEQQKSAMMRRWGEKYGDMATLGSLLDIAKKNGWSVFIREVCAEMNVDLESLQAEEPAVEGKPLE